MPWSFHGETPAFGNARQRFLREIPARRVKFTQAGRLKLIFTLRIEQLLGAGVVGFRHEDPSQPVQIAIIRGGRVHELVDGDDAVFFQHEHQQLRLDERAGEEQFARGRHIRLFDRGGRFQPPQVSDSVLPEGTARRRVAQAELQIMTGCVGVEFMFGHDRQAPRHHV